MARVRHTNTGADPLLTPPPAELLPEHIAALAAELRRLTDEHGTISSRLATLRVRRLEDEQIAKQADAEAAATAARAGEPSPGTPASDRLATERAEVEHQTDALAGAIAQVRADLSNALMEHRDGTGATDLTKARAELQRAGVAFTKALTRAAQARGIADWTYGLAYDATARVHILDLNRASSSHGRALLDVPPLDGFAVIAGLTTITDDN